VETLEVILMRMAGTIDWNEIIKLKWRSDYWTIEIDDINEHWEEQVASFGDIRITPDEGSLHNAVLDFVKPDSDETILDVASGPGKLTLPLARKVKKVTAVDFSKNLLDAMAHHLRELSIANVDQCFGRFLELNPGEDYPIHDTVIACQCLGVISANSKKETLMEECLRKLNDSAQKRVYIVLPSMYASLDPEFLSLYPEDRRLRIWSGEVEAFNLAHEMGFMPRMDYLPHMYDETFESFDEAVEETMAMMEIEPFFKDMVSEYLNKKITRGDNRFHLRIPALSQCIWWKKDENWIRGYVPGPSVK
jgi:SAM-dependent methyltransferase